MRRQNIICADDMGVDICTICSIGDDLDGNMVCEFDNQHTDDGCPGFQCTEQCRLCPSTCEFSGGANNGNR